MKRTDSIALETTLPHTRKDIKFTPRRMIQHDADCDLANVSTMELGIKGPGFDMTLYTFIVVAGLLSHYINALFIYY